MWRMDAKLLSDMFSLGLPVAEKVLRPVFVYIFLIVGLRLAGKRELAQLNPFDLVVLLTLSNAVQNAIIGDDNSITGGVILRIQGHALGNKPRIIEDAFTVSRAQKPP